MSMLNIDELKAKIEQLDADRLRVFNELSKRKRDLKRYAGKITDKLADIEREKISNLQDVLEDIEFDLTGYLGQLFDFAGNAEFEDHDETFLDMLTNTPEQETATDERQELIARRDKTQHDLEMYKKQAEKMENQLQELQDLIDATENELDDIIVELAELPD